MRQQRKSVCHLRCEPKSAYPTLQLIRAAVHALTLDKGLASASPRHDEKLDRVVVTSAGCMHMTDYMSHGVVKERSETQPLELRVERQ